MDTSRGLGIGHALDAMDARLELQSREGSAPGNLRDDLLEAALGAFACRQQFGLPAAPRGIALIHAIEIAGEQRRLVAAGAGADFEDDALLVHRVLGGERKADVVLERVALGFEQWLLLARDRAHGGLGRGIRDDLVNIADLSGNAAV